MKTAISMPDDTFARVEKAAALLGISRSEFLARAAIRLLADLENETTTAAIDRVLHHADPDTAFVRRAAGVVARDADGW